MTRTDPAPDVSFVVPAMDEAGYIRDTVESIRGLDTDYTHETIVVDGGSTDGTTDIARECGARVVDQEGTGIGAARHQGAREASADWFAFVDADTVLRANYLTELLGFVQAEGLAAASSRCRITGPWRAKAMEATINYLFPYLSRPILPGFNLLVRREVYEGSGGFPNVGNEDTAYSRRLARQYPTGYCPEVLVESSGRRIARVGLTGAAVHYLSLDVARLRSGY